MYATQVNLPLSQPATLILSYFLPPIPCSLLATHTMYICNVPSSLKNLLTLAAQSSNRYIPVHQEYFCFQDPVKFGNRIYAQVVLMTSLVLNAAFQTTVGTIAYRYTHTHTLTHTHSHTHTRMERCAGRRARTRALCMCKLLCFASSFSMCLATSYTQERR